MYCVALTGGIASGKTTVASLFANLGIPCIFTDVVAKEITGKQGACFKAISDYFGEQCINPKTGDLNRVFLRENVFKNPKKRLWLEALTHPYIRSSIEKQITTLNSPYCLIEIPLLTQPTLYPYLSRVLLVLSSPNEQLKRVQSRDNSSVEQAKAIINAQPSDRQRRAIADDIIINSTTLASLKTSVDDLHNTYLKLSSP